MNISELAAEKLKDILNEEGAPEASLRILATPGENGGLSYMMTLEKQVIRKLILQKFLTNRCGKNLDIGKNLANICLPPIHLMKKYLL